MKLVLVTGDGLIKFLISKGFKVTRRKGSHVQLEDDLGHRVTVPVHGNRKIGRGLLSRILRDAEISKDEYVSWVTSK